MNVDIANMLKSVSVKCFLRSLSVSRMYRNMGLCEKYRNESICPLRTDDCDFGTSLGFREKKARRLRNC